MGKTAVVYKSNYGSTKKYAEWIAKALEADLFDAAKVRVQDVIESDTVILGGGLYASGILGSDFITKNYASLKDKKLVVFTVGLANPKLTDYSAIIEKNFQPEIRSAIRIFHFRGAIDYKNINFKHRTMMSLLVKKVSKIDKANRDDEINQMLDTYGKTVDFTDESSISELIGYCRGL